VGKLVLERGSRELYRLEDVGTLGELSGLGSEIEAGGVLWTVKRTAGGFDQTIRAAGR